MCRTLIAGFPMPSGCQWWAFLHLGCTLVCLTASAWSEGCCSWSPTWPFVRRGEVCACDGTPGIPANVTILGNNESNGFVCYRRLFPKLLFSVPPASSGLRWGSFRTVVTPARAASAGSIPTAEKNNKQKKTREKTLHFGGYKLKQWVEPVKVYKQLKNSTFNALTLSKGIRKTFVLSVYTL